MKKNKLSSMDKLIRTLSPLQKALIADIMGRNYPDFDKEMEKLLTKILQRENNKE